MRATHRILILVMTSVLFVAMAAVPATAGNEGTLLSRINASRAAAGKPPVEVYWDLTDDARAHTSAMIANGSIYHNPGLSGVTGVWHALGENVGVGFDANQLHDAFMASSGHKANILGDYNYVGIGAKAGADGLVWATVIFMRAEPGLNGGGTTTTTVAPTTTTTTTIAPTTTTTIAQTKEPPASQPKPPTGPVPDTPSTTSAQPVPSEPPSLAQSPDELGTPEEADEPIETPVAGYGRPAGPALAI